jgi:hypothetical protein
MKKTLLSTIVASMLLGMTSLEASNILDLTSNINKSYSKNNYAKNEVIIVFKDNIKIPNSFYNFIKKFSYQKYNLSNAMHIKSSNISTKNLIKLFKDSKFSSFISAVTPNYKYLPIATSDTYYNKLWAIENTGQKINNKKGTKDADMDINLAWEKEKGSHDVIVAVLDTGVDYTHNDLADNMYNGLEKHGYDFAGDDNGNNDDDPMPDQPYDKKGHYHGTHVAGTIGAVGDNAEGVSGVNQNVQIMAVKVFRPKGYAYTSDILEGLDFVAKRIDQGDNIVAINASYGGGGGSQDDATNKAIKKLGKKGVVFCAAAGNDGKDIDKHPTYPASYDAPNIITIAATDQNDKLASFSNYGKKSVDVAAPGTNILSTYPENKYAYLQGTSMATPHVTGEVALISAYNPDLNVTQKIEIIENSVDKKSELEEKIASGGRVNANNALIEIDNNDNNGNNTNHSPIANTDSATMNEDSSIKIDVLANDSDVDGDTLTVISTSKPAHGSATINSDNTITYTPNKDFNGKDSFLYTISDGKGGKTSARVNITIKNVNDAPIAKDDNAQTNKNRKVTIDVLANDSDIDGDTLTIISLSNPTNGSVKIEKNKVTYTPNKDFTGTDNFNYTISDGNGAKASAKVTVTVKEGNSGLLGGLLGWLF